MITYLLTYKLESEEKRNAFLSELRQNKADVISRAEDGCIKYSYYLPCDDNATLFLVEMWESEAHQKKHTTQPHFKIIQELKQKYNVTTECDSL